MTKKKVTTTKKPVVTWKSILKDAKKRLPSERSKVRCDGCFNPRNTITVKGNLEFVWTKEQVEIASTEQGVYVPCSICGVVRFLHMSKFSLDILRADYEVYKGFTLLKDDKYNALIGIDVSGLPIDVKEWSK